MIKTEKELRQKVTELRAAGEESTADCFDYLLDRINQVSAHAHNNECMIEDAKRARL